MNWCIFLYQNEFMQNKHIDVTVNNVPIMIPAMQHIVYQFIHMEFTESLSCNIKQDLSEIWIHALIQNYGKYIFVKKILAFDVYVDNGYGVSTDILQPCVLSPAYSLA